MHLFYFFIWIFYWCVIDEQCCVRFKHTARWFSYTYTCIYSFLPRSKLHMGSKFMPIFSFQRSLLLFKIISVLTRLSKSFKNVAQNKGSVKLPRVKTRWRNMITWLVWLALVIIMSFQKTWRYLIHLINGLMTGNIYLFLSSCLATLVTHTA